MGEGRLVAPRVRAAVERFRAATGIERVIVFGSHATGHAREDSDVDLVLVDPRFRGVKSFHRPVGLARHWPRDIPVDMICYTPEEFEELKARPTIAREAALHGVEA